jgi:hypothetical protein
MFTSPKKKVKKKKKGEEIKKAEELVLEPSSEPPKDEERNEVVKESEFEDVNKDLLKEENDDNKELFDFCSAVEGNENEKEKDLNIVTQTFENFFSTNEAINEVDEQKKEEGKIKQENVDDKNEDVKDEEEGEKHKHHHHHRHHHHHHHKKDRSGSEKADGGDHHRSRSSRDREDHHRSGSGKDHSKSVGNRDGYFKIRIDKTSKSGRGKKSSKDGDRSSSGKDHFRPVSGQRYDKNDYNRSRSGGGFHVKEKNVNFINKTHHKERKNRK